MNRMYYTYEFEVRDRQLTVDNILDKLYAGEDYSEPVVGTNPLYKDLSYLRTRTIKVHSFDKLMQSNNLNKHMSTFASLIAQMEEYLILQFNPTFTTSSGATATVTYSGLPSTMLRPIHYTTFQIPKASGGTRTIKTLEAEENERAKRYAKAITHHIGALPHDAAYAYIPGRDCKKAIERHQSNGANWFLKLDLKNFFDNCTPEVVATQLKKIYPFFASPYNTDKFLHLLSNIAYDNGSLPQGSPLSPVLTNLLMVPFDHGLSRALHAYSDEHLTYTRYADDILISSRKEMVVEDIVNIVKLVLKECDLPFELNETKTRYGSKAGRNWNLGIMYNKDNNLTVGHKRKHRLKTMLFKFYTEAEHEVAFLQELQGELAYMRNIEPDYYNHLDTWVKSKYNNTNGLTAIKMALKK